MASMTEDRTEVGASDMGNVFIFHFIELEDYRDVPKLHRYEVRAGNHTVITTPDLSVAQGVANAMCGIAAPDSPVDVTTCAQCSHDAHEGACAYRTADYYCDCGRPADAEVPEVEPGFVASTRARVSKGPK